MLPDIGDNGPMSTPNIAVRAGDPDFLDLPWGRSITEWDHERRLLLPKGISRHEVQFYGYPEGVYAIKELPLAAARHEYEALRRLETLDAPAVRAAGLVERSWVPPDEEWSAAVITRYLQHAFSYRELLSGWGFGERRNQMLDAFAGLLAELHLTGCYWGDCSLSNVLYRFDADAIDVRMVDAETARLYDTLSDGQRHDDIELMIINVAGGMADIAAAQGVDIDAADLALGEAIADRYHGLWSEATRDEVFGSDEQWRITERVRRLNDLGFEVDDMQLIPEAAGSRLRLSLTVGGRRFHTQRLRQLTGVEATEHQARQILSDLNYFEAKLRVSSPAEKDLASVMWRAQVFEPYLRRIAAITERRASDPVQAFCDLLHHRYVMSSEAERDVPTEEAYATWLATGQPGYPVG